MNKNSLLKALFLCLFIFIGVTNSLACMYGPPYKTVCQAFAEADTVIVGKIESVEPKEWRQIVSIAVEKTYKGQIKKKIVLNEPLSSCDWDFLDKIGKTLLLYLERDQKTGEYGAMAEGMGGRIEEESDDLYWLDNLPRSLARTRISGSIKVYNDEPFELLSYGVGSKVRIFNDKNSFEAKTDENGVYQIWDIPAGKYRIQSALPDNLQLRFNIEKGLVDF